MSCIDSSTGKCDDCALWDGRECEHETKWQGVVASSATTGYETDPAADDEAEEHDDREEEDE